MGAVFFQINLYYLPIQRSQVGIRICIRVEADYHN
jgi:hypothetical protein